jgi:D-alanine--poly(phosphoribitol) ligase subunit 2
MDTTKVKTTLKEFLLGSFRIQNINDTDNIFDTGIVHSLFFIQLLVYIEKKFKVEFLLDEIDIDELSTINQIADLIVSKTNSKIN